MESGIHLGRAASLAGENDVSATGRRRGGRVSGHVENRRFFIRGPSINFRKPARAYKRTRYMYRRRRRAVSLYSRRTLNFQTRKKKNFTDVYVSAARQPRVVVHDPELNFYVHTYSFYPIGVFTGRRVKYKLSAAKTLTDAGKQPLRRRFG